MHVCRCAEAWGAFQQHPCARSCRRSQPAPACAGEGDAPLPQAVPAMLRGGWGVSAVDDTRGHCLSSVAASFWDVEQNWAEFRNLILINS